MSTTLGRALYTFGAWGHLNTTHQRRCNQDVWALDRAGGWDGVDLHPGRVSCRLSVFYGGGDYLAWSGPQYGGEFHLSRKDNVLAGQEGGWGPVLLAPILATKLPLPHTF